jgi:hypothetical protein
MIGSSGTLGENRDKYDVPLGKLQGQRTLIDLHKKLNILLKWLLNK